MNKNILNRLLVVIVLGYDRLTEEICGQLDQEDPIYLIPMRGVVEAHNRQRKHRKMPLELLEDQAGIALHERKPLVVMTGFPKTYVEACDIESLCPHLLTVSLENCKGTAFHAASKHYFDGLSRVEFESRFAREENELKGIKHVLGRGEVPVIDGGFPLARQRRFLMNRIREFRLGTVISLHASDMARTAPPVSGALATA